MQATAYMLVDGENVDATLGGSILGRRPQSDERPRWDRLTSFVARTWNERAQGVFFINASSGVPLPFVQALKAMDYRVVLLSGEPDEKVVDMAIVRTMEALEERAGDVMLVSNDGDFIEPLARLADGRRLGVIGFDEFRNAGFRDVPGVQLYDLEYDVSAFDAPLPRLRVVPIAEFDPASVLD